jgi:hypothetical protein
MKRPPTKKHTQLGSKITPSQIYEKDKNQPFPAAAAIFFCSFSFSIRYEKDTNEQLQNI